MKKTLRRNLLLTAATVATITAVAAPLSVVLQTNANSSRDSQMERNSATTAEQIAAQQATREYTYNELINMPYVPVATANSDDAYYANKYFDHPEYGLAAALTSLDASVRVSQSTIYNIAYDAAKLEAVERLIATPRQAQPFDPKNPAYYITVLARPSNLSLVFSQRMPRRLEPEFSLRAFVIKSATPYLNSWASIYDAVGQFNLMPYVKSLVNINNGWSGQYRNFDLSKVRLTGDVRDVALDLGGQTLPEDTNLTFTFYNGLNVLTEFSFTYLRLNLMLYYNFFTLSQFRDLKVTLTSPAHASFVAANPKTRTIGLSGIDFSSKTRNNQ